MLENYKVKPVCPHCDHTYIKYIQREQAYRCYGCGELFETPSKRPVLIYDESRKKIKPATIEQLNPNRVLRLIEENLEGCPRDQALLSFIYLTGARINEVLKRFKMGQIDFNGFTFEEINTKEFDDNFNGIIRFKSVYVEKRREDNIVRDVPVNYYKEDKFIDYIIRYIEDIGYEEDKSLFNVGYDTVKKQLKRKTGLFFHYFRHLRYSEWARQGLSSYDLKALAGWKSIAPSDQYVHLNTKDIERKLIGK